MEPTAANVAPPRAVGIGSPDLFRAARRLELTGDSLVAAGQIRPARTVLETAADVYVNLGCAQAARRVQQRLAGLSSPADTRGCGGHPVSGWPSLTVAERRVACVIAEGMTNREAARQLYLSPHTVDSHLRHAFQKLGIRSRVQLTRLVLENVASEPLGA